MSRFLWIRGYFSKPNGVLEQKGLGNTGLHHFSFTSYVIWSVVTVRGGGAELLVTLYWTSLIFHNTFWLNLSDYSGFELSVIMAWVIKNNWQSWISLGILCVSCEFYVLRSWDHASLMYSSKTNKMQRYTIVFITINALHVSGGSSAHHQELKTVYTASGICRAVFI